MLTSDYSLGKRFIEESFDEKQSNRYLGGTFSHLTLEMLWSSSDIIGFIRKCKKSEFSDNGKAISVTYYTITGTIIAKEYDMDKITKKLRVW